MKITVASDNEIVVVDDDRLEQASFMRIYKRSQLKHQLVLLNSGQALVSYMKTVAEENMSTPALIFCDWRMPGMQNGESIRSIRSMSRFKDSPPIVVLSHSILEEDLSTALNAGANHFQLKPSTVREFVEFLNAFVHNPQNA